MRLERPRKSRGAGALSLTPLIDVVFMLLLFFMLATNFEKWRVMDVEAAVTRKSRVAVPSQSVLLRISGDGLDVAGKSTTLALLGDILQPILRAQSGRLVVVRPKADVSLQRIVDVMDKLKSIGVSRTKLSLD